MSIPTETADKLIHFHQVKSVTSTIIRQIEADLYQDDYLVIYLQDKVEEMFAALEMNKGKDYRNSVPNPRYIGMYYLGENGDYKGAHICVVGADPDHNLLIQTNKQEFRYVLFAAINFGLPIVGEDYVDWTSTEYPADKVIYEL